MPAADYNVAPTTHQPIIRQSKENGEARAHLGHVGPHPALHQRPERDQGAIDHQCSRGNNRHLSHLARTDEEATLPDSGKRVYEWPKEGKPPKQPYAFELSSGNLFAFAGIWDAWKDGEGHWLQSYAIVTTEANELMSRIHPRMPVILHSRDYDRWLDREETGQLPLDLLRPFESEAMEMHEGESEGEQRSKQRA